MVCTLTHTETLRHVFFLPHSACKKYTVKKCVQQDAATTLCAETH